MGFSFASYGEVIRVRADRVQARKGVGFIELNFFIETTSVPQDKAVISISSFHGDVNVSNGTQGQHYLGTAEATQSTTFEYRNSLYVNQFNLRLKLSLSEFEALESLRNGGELSFSMHLGAKVSDQQNSHYMYEMIHFKPNQKDWVNLLNSVHYSNIFLFELPLPTVTSSEELKKLNQLIHKAQQYHLNGGYNDSVATCRNILELIPQLFPEENIIEDANILYRGKAPDRQNMTKHQREVAFREALKHFSHLAHHPTKQGELEQFTRDDSSFFICCAISLSAKYAKTYP